MTNLSKTTAMKLASRVVGTPSRRSQTEFVFYAPHNSAKPEGPDTEITSSSWAGILARRTEKMAYVALAAMGVDLKNVMLEADQWGRENTVSRLIDEGIKQAMEAPTQQEQSAAEEAFWASQK